jgi:hypothetical protein
VGDERQICISETELTAVSQRVAFLGASPLQTSCVCLASRSLCSAAIYCWTNGRVLPAESWRASVTLDTKRHDSATQTGANSYFEEWQLAV